MNKRKNYVFVFILSLFPHSLYICTAITRQQTISALNPFAAWGCCALRKFRVIRLAYTHRYEFAAQMLWYDCPANYNLGVAQS